ncbi:MAG TPA: AAA family ATPase [Chloroflexi bacterium]|nr:AAA family ATPase [Chloroflexota bacterium]
MGIAERERELEVLIRAKYSLIYILSWEERRIEALLVRIAARLNLRLYAWTITTGVLAVDTVRPTEVDPGARSALQALEHIESSREAALYLLKDFHPFLGGAQMPPDPAVVRKVRDLVQPLKESRKTVLFLSPVLRLPPELEKEITLVDYSLPAPEDLEEALERLIRSAEFRKGGLHLGLSGEEREQILQAARGLTVSEAENVFAKSLVVAHKFDRDGDKPLLRPEIVIAEKKQLIRKSNVLEYYEAAEEMSYVGGMNELKGWLRKRRLAFTEQARAFGLPEPRGLLLLGVQGGGKSLIAKAVSTVWKLPLLRLDMGRVFGELVGASEENMRAALRLAEAVSPAVLWIDEIEKGLSGLASSGRSDAGTAARVFGSFLVWMQEKTAPVFVIATSNDITMLPPELLRKGRFDEIFFVDLPNFEERQEIFAIHLHKRRRDPDRFDRARLARETDGFSGAEIEQVVIAGLYDAFEAGRDLEGADLLHNIQQTIPLSQTMREQVTALRNWARTHARPASSDAAVQRIAAPAAGEYSADLHVEQVEA